MVLQQIQGTAEEVAAQVEKIDEFLMSQMKPQHFHGSTGVEVRVIKGFEQTCVLLVKHGVTVDPKKLTVIEFYQALEVVKEALKKSKKNSRK